MISLEDLLRRHAALDRHELVTWVENRWVLPERRDKTWIFHDVDVARFDADAPHVRQQRSAGIKKNGAVDYDSAVVTLGREGRPRAEECKFQATVTALFR